MDEKQIRKWISAPERGRDWLAWLLSVNRGTVNNWFSDGFPAKVIHVINMIADPPAGKAGLEVSFTAAQFERIEQAREISGQTTRKAFYEAAILDYTERLIRKAKR